jgi:DnaK suppressor protein
MPELKTFESVLQARARELAHSLADRNPIRIDRSADAFDGRLHAADRESSAQVLAEDFRLLRQVEAARNRIQDGTFGICLRCEEGIPLKRFQAIPWAAFCKSCQEMAEEANTYRPKLARAA